MPICDYCGSRCRESEGEFHERATGRIGAGYNFGIGQNGKRTRKSASRTGSRKTYKQVFVCYSCEPRKPVSKIKTITILIMIAIFVTMCNWPKSEKTYADGNWDRHMPTQSH